MDTIPLNIAYRPLRICWAIKDGDFDAFREAVRSNYALWGGRFNPIAIVDHTTEADLIAKTFRADVIIQAGKEGETAAFAAKHNHLISPFIPDSLFSGEKERGFSQVLDVRNELAYIYDKPDFKQIKDKKPRIYKWSEDDPLTDVLLVMLGSYPAKEAIHIEYEQTFKEALGADEVTIEKGAVLPSDIFEHPSIAYLSRHRLRPHYDIQSDWNYPGFFIGDAQNLQDLVTFWNLRAANIHLQFINQTSIERFKNDIPNWKKQVAEVMAQRRIHSDAKCAIWSQRNDEKAQSGREVLLNELGDGPFVICEVDEHLWGGNNLRPPMMYFEEVETSGILDDAGEKPKISFSLSDRPYALDVRYHSQFLVASINIIGGLYGRDDFTLDPPYIPQLNEFYARSMHIYDTLRIESGRIGLIVNTTTANSSISALPTAELFKNVFRLAGFKAEISSGGLIARQIISQLGGLQGARVFKIPGVRRLLKTHGPSSSFLKGGALQLIGGRDDENPNAKFDDHKNLYLEPRERGQNLTAEEVFSYLVRKRIFRIGYDLICPRCQLQSWFPVDDLKQYVSCQMCGENFDSTQQLVKGQWTYRRSGVLGLERNAQGGVPVSLTLQQLDTNLNVGLLQKSSYSVSLDIEPLNGQLPNKCEVDLAWLIPRPYPEKTIVLIGECKDRGRASGHNEDGGTINANDINNLCVIADSFPSDSFEVFIILAKLCDFTPEEVDLARSLNNRYQCRVIMLTDRELEPYHVYERTGKQFEIDMYGISPQDLARATVSIFLNPQRKE